jgi:hypothetical protein
MRLSKQLPTQLVVSISFKEEDQILSDTDFRKMRIKVGHLFKTECMV